MFANSFKCMKMEINTNISTTTKNKTFNRSNTGNLQRNLPIRKKISFVNSYNCTNDIFRNDRFDERVVCKHCNKSI